MSGKEGKNILRMTSKTNFGKFGTIDPDFKKFSYSEVRPNFVTQLKNLKKGNYLFFLGKLKDYWFIQGYLVVSEVKVIEDIIRDPKYSSSIPDDNACEFDGAITVFGDSKKSMIRSKPLLFDRNLASKIGFEPYKPITFEIGGSPIVDKNGKIRTDAEIIWSATRTPRYLTDNDVNIILSEIKKCLI